MADSSTGVTVDDATQGLEAAWLQVKPDKAKSAARAAVEEQEQWMAARPANGGIGPGYLSKSVYFRYRKFTDARVDVENLRGYNLRLP